MKYPYMVALAGSLMPGRYGDLDEAVKAANGMLLSRSADRKAEVLCLIEDVPPTGWPVVATMLPTTIKMIDCRPNTTGIYDKYCTDHRWPEWSGRDAAP